MLKKSTNSKDLYNSVFEQAQEQLKKLKKELEEFEDLRTSDDMDEIDENKLKAFVAGWKTIFDFGTQHQKRNLIASLVNEIRVTKEEIYIDAALDIPSFVESISNIKESASAEIAASVDITAFIDDEPYLYNDDSGSTDSIQNTGIIETLSGKEIKEFTKKLSKVFTNKIKNEFTISA